MIQINKIFFFFEYLAKISNKNLSCFLFILLSCVSVVIVDKVLKGSFFKKLFISFQIINGFSLLINFSHKHVNEILVLKKNFVCPGHHFDDNIEF